MTQPEIRITLADCRNPKSFACRDMRELFFYRFGLDWKRFCREGMTVAELRAPGQHLDLISRLEQTAIARLARKG
jgi:hypothetical protein